MSRRVYRGRVVELTLDDVVLPNGRRFELEHVHHPGGAAVAAIDGAERVCLLRQYRHIAGDWLWEVPAGKRDGGEPPLATAQRELAEEAGRAADRWLPLGRLLSSPGVFDETIHLFLAEGLSELPSAHEPEELIEVHWIPLDEALSWAAEGRVNDAKSVAALFRAYARLSQSGGFGPRL